MAASNAYGKRILVADDNEAIRVMLEDILSEAGYPVAIAEDGQETYDFLARENVDLVILDILMPQKSGFEILEWLSTRASRPIVLVLTGIFRSPKEIERLKQLGAKGYIYKSAPVEEILFRVNHVLYCGEKDTRSHPRIPVNLSVDYRINSKWHQAYGSTLGGNGLFIRTVNPPEKGIHISVKFTLPNKNRMLEAEGKVVWSNEYDASSRKTSLPGMGIEFSSISEEDKKEILSYIHEQLSKELFW